MSTSQFRQRFSKRSTLATSDNIDYDKDSAHHRLHSDLNGSVWKRVVRIVLFFILLVSAFSSLGNHKEVSAHSDSNSALIVNQLGSLSAEAEINMVNMRSTENPLFVTIVMPSVVRPEGQSVRLNNIGKTWGPFAHAIFVMHSTDEYSKIANIPVPITSKSLLYPQLLRVPSNITTEMGIQRLEYVIRSVHEYIDPGFAFFVNDHTFVFPDHLCKFVKDRDSSIDLYAGHPLKGKGETVFNSGAAGYVLSRSTIHKLISEWDKSDSKCSSQGTSLWYQGNPGLLTAKCFDEVLHIPVIDTRDETDHSHLFHAFGLVRTVTGNVDEWYLNKHNQLDVILGEDKVYHHRPQKGALCCSVFTISFHYVEAAECLALWQVIENIRKSTSLTNDEIKEFMIEMWPHERESLGAYAHGLPSSNSSVWNELLQVVRRISVDTGRC